MHPWYYIGMATNKTWRTGGSPDGADLAPLPCVEQERISLDAMDRPRVDVDVDNMLPTHDLDFMTMSEFDYDMRYVPACTCESAWCWECSGEEEEFEKWGAV